MPYVFLPARMVYTCSASFVQDDQSLIELIEMQQNCIDRKYTVKFFSSDGFKEEISVVVFCCLFAYL